jgi:hypothetical protein
MTAGEIDTASLREPRNDEGFEIATPAGGGLAMTEGVGLPFGRLAMTEGED